MAEKTLDTFGKIDVLINNVSIYLGLENKPLEFITEEEWDRTFSVDVLGTVVFLASEDSDFITGQNIVCDGGWVMY